MGTQILYSPYSRLVEAKGAIRLVLLSPGNFQDTLECRLVEDTWERPKMEYEALSYVWGSSNNRKSIMLNGMEFSVTQNLYSALRNIRSAYMIKILWIDAICINQEDIRERESQVQHMGEIYRNASGVIIWLGETNDDSQRALSFIGLLHGNIPLKDLYKFTSPETRGHIRNALSTATNVPRFYLSRAWSSSKSLPSSVMENLNALDTQPLDTGLGVRKPLRSDELNGSSNTHPRLHQDMRTNSSTSMVKLLAKAEKWLDDPSIRMWTRPEYTSYWQSVWRLMMREWWQRAWVVQEHANARDIQFRIGKDSFEGDSLFVIIAFIRYAAAKWTQAEIKFGCEENSFLVVENAYQLMQHRMKINRRKLTDLFVGQRDRECFDPRDKIYSVLSLTDPSFSSKIKVEYTKSIEWVYINVVRTYMQASRSLTILRTIMPRTEEASLPSWCPDWTVTQSRSVLEGRLESTHSLPYRRDWKISEDLKTLQIPGCVQIGYVESVNLESSADNFQWEDGKHGPVCSWDIHSIAENLPRLNRFMKLSEHRDQSLFSLFRTLVADQHPPKIGLKLVKDSSTSLRWPQHRALYFQQIEERTMGRTLILSEQGLLGLGPQDTEPGDTIFILPGCDLPMVCRMAPGIDTWTLVGDVYIDALMYPEEFYPGVNTRRMFMTSEEDIDLV